MCGERVTVTSLRRHDPHQLLTVGARFLAPSQPWFPGSRAPHSSGPRALSEWVHGRLRAPRAAARLTPLPGHRDAPGRAPLAEVLEPALRGGVDLVQLRAKDAGDEEILTAAAEARPLCAAAGALLLVNDRPDLAVAAGADGVHVGQDDMAVAEARAITGAAAARRAVDAHAGGDRRPPTPTTSASDQCTRRPRSRGAPPSASTSCATRPSTPSCRGSRSAGSTPHPWRRSSMRARRGSRSSGPITDSRDPEAAAGALRAALPQEWWSMAVRSRKARPEPRTPPARPRSRRDVHRALPGTDGVAQRGGARRPRAPRPRRAPEGRDDRGDRRARDGRAERRAPRCPAARSPATREARPRSPSSPPRSSWSSAPACSSVITGPCSASRSSSGCRSRRCRSRSCSPRNLPTAALLLVLVVLLGTLFWKLIRAMARMQMPVLAPESDPPPTRAVGSTAAMAELRLHRHRVRSGRLRRRHPRRPSGTEDRRDREGRDRRPVPELRLHPREGGAAHGGHPLGGPRRRRVRHQGRRAGGGLRRRDRAPPQGRPDADRRRRRPLQEERIEVLEGEASLGGGGTVRVGGEEHKAGKIIIATGSLPRPIPGTQFGGRVIGTEEAWALRRAPLPPRRRRRRRVGHRDRLRLRAPRLRGHAARGHRPRPADRGRRHLQGRRARLQAPGHRRPHRRHGREHPEHATPA